MPDNPDGIDDTMPLDRSNYSCVMDCKGYLNFLYINHMAKPLVLFY